MKAKVSISFNIELADDCMYEEAGQDKVTVEMKLMQEKLDIMEMSQTGDNQLLDLISMGQPMINVELVH
jgi:hypothetical protein